MSPSAIGKRRSSRVPEERPIEVSGTNVEGVGFLAHSRTLILSRHGAKIIVREALIPDQEVTVYCPETRQECSARVVALYSQESDSYSYGIEFLDPKINFWNIPFAPGADGAASTSPTEASASAGLEEDTPSESESDRPMEAVERPKAAVAKNYAVRLKCPHGGEDQWVILQNREEPLEQILATPWHFQCPFHGLQRELPMEAREARARPPSSPPPKIPTELIQPERSASKRAKELRALEAHRVWVRGMDANGNHFAQTAYSMDVSRNGARLEGVGFLTAPGQTVEVKRGWTKAMFRVVWVGDFGTPRSGQVGIRCLEPEKNIWGLPEHTPRSKGT